MDAAGVLDQRYDEVDDLNRARNLPSLQLAGYPDRRDVDLNALGALGVRRVGRLAGIREGKAQFSGSLPNVAALADLKLGRLLDLIDDWASRNPAGGDLPPPYRPERTRIPASPPLSLDLARGEIRAIIGDEARFVIDTSRNGLGPTDDSEWCNPQGRANGRRPSLNVAREGLDARLWIKTPGRSDGYCNGGPEAGDWWPEYARGLWEEADLLF